MDEIQSNVGRKDPMGNEIKTGSNKLSGGDKTSRRWAGMLVILLTAMTVSAQAPRTGFTRTLAQVKFPKDDKPDCLQFAVENGDLKTGPSTAIMKAAPNCVVPPHYHSAEEQLIIVRGEVSTGMEGMTDALLGPGGFAMMASKQVHWFTCTAKEECLMFVTFDRAYDIVWVKEKK